MSFERQEIFGFFSTIIVIAILERVFSFKKGNKLKLFMLALLL